MRFRLEESTCQGSMSVMAILGQLQSQHLIGEEQAVKQLRQLRDDLRTGTNLCPAIMHPLIYWPEDLT